MSNKTSFIIHLDSLDVIDDLSDEQCGELLRAMKAYHLNNDYTPSAIVKVAFSPFKNQFIRDAKKYEAIVERNRNNGLKGGRPRKEEKPTGLFGNPEEPKKADSVSDSKNDSDSVSDKDSKKEKEELKNLFDSFWKNYPRKDDKKKAGLAFNRLTKQKKEKAIIDCKARYAETDKKFIPLATTYINGERWDDEIIKSSKPISKHSGFQEKDYQAGATDISTLEWMK